MLIILPGVVLILSHMSRINFFICKKLIFFYVLDRFDMLILKIILKNKKTLF